MAVQNTQIPTNAHEIILHVANCWWTIVNMLTKSIAYVLQNTQGQFFFQKSNYEWLYTLVIIIHNNNNIDYYTFVVWWVGAYVYQFSLLPKLQQSSHPALSFSASHDTFLSY